ncbi:hypothetical protein F5Y03DRAFT_381065 [Xylaria venustula]|nr:hypothetical protein F5Y03DRAFT_381065 [Xylaria venustula]
MVTNGSDGQVVMSAGSHVKRYLLETVPTFQRLNALREKGWNNPQGDRYFARQRRNADTASDQQAHFFLKMMKDVGREIHDATRIFDVRTLDNGPAKILDMCMAPGAFTYLAMEKNPGAQARAFSLPPDKGGHEVLIPPNPDLTIEFVDITMLAADMGVNRIPLSHPEAHEFLPKKLYPQDVFDLAICDGQVLRTHHRAAHRESREVTRLALTQLAIAVEHMKPGGSMLILIHKVEAWKSVMLLRTFSRFSNVKVFKPRRAHAKRGSCYIVASNIQPQHEDAIRAVRTWKQLWKSATFDTESDFERLSASLEPDVNEVLGDFGATLVGFGQQPWEIQADALDKAPFVRGWGS